MSPSSFSFFYKDLTFFIIFSFPVCQRTNHRSTKTPLFMDTSSSPPLIVMPDPTVVPGQPLIVMPDLIGHPCHFEPAMSFLSMNLKRLCRFRPYREISYHHNWKHCLDTTQNKIPPHRHRRGWNEKNYYIL